MRKHEYFTDEHICKNLGNALRVVKNRSTGGHTMKNWWLYDAEYDDISGDADWYPVSEISYCPCCGQRLPK